jgi:DNA-binding NtrC family response regulator
VGELRNALERALLLAEGDAITAADLPAAVTAAGAASGVAGQAGPALRPAEAAVAELPWADARRRAAEAFDRAFLAAALERQGGNVSAAARAVGVHRQTLQKLMARLGLRDAAGE